MYPKTWDFEKFFVAHGRLAAEDYFCNVSRTQFCKNIFVLEIDLHSRFERPVCFYPSEKFKVKFCFYVTHEANFYDLHIFIKLFFQLVNSITPVQWPTKIFSKRLVYNFNIKWSSTFLSHQLIKIIFCNSFKVTHWSLDPHSNEDASISSPARTRTAFILISKHGILIC